MSTIQQRALGILHRNPFGMTASDLGNALWHNVAWPVPDASQQRNRYCRSAGRVLRGLAAAGLVTYTDRDRRRLWRVKGGAK